MAKRVEKLVNVHLDAGDFTYPLDASRKRTLPKGWRGQVTANVGKAIERDGAGKVLGALREPKPKASGTSKKPAGAAKKPAGTKITAGGQTKTTTADQTKAPAAPGGPKG